MYYICKVRMGTESAFALSPRVALTACFLQKSSFFLKKHQIRMKINIRVALSRLFAGMALLGLSTLCYAQQNSTDIPRVLSYQGQIQSSTGLPVNGPQSITVRLYSDSAGQQLVWEDRFVTPVQSGEFNILLGSQRPLPDASQFS